MWDTANPNLPFHSSRKPAGGIVCSLGAQPRDLGFEARRACPELVEGADRQTSAQPGTRISCHAAPDKATCAPFRKERSMKFAEATRFQRKSGGRAGRSIPQHCPTSRVAGKNDAVSHKSCGIRLPQLLLSWGHEKSTAVHLGHARYGLRFCATTSPSPSSPPPSSRQPVAIPSGFSTAAGETCVAEPPERWCPQSGAAGVDTIGMQVKCLYPAASDAAHAAVNLWFSWA